MENRSLDPYEEQLLKVFSSHDADDRGSLDEEGLQKLCETLQLEDRTDELTKALLDNQKGARVTFPEFKDALLNLLGNMQNADGDDFDLNASPEREVSPKFVYGSKKYGRRSRRELINQSTINDVKSINVSVQRSNSQSEVSYSKKRKTNSKLKRCTSFPSVADYKGEVVYTEEMLREAWKKLGVGEDGYLNRTELIVVCDAIGLNKLADSVIRQLSNKVVLDYNKRISFQELLEALQQDETWHEFLNSPVESDVDLQNLSLNHSAAAVHGSKILQHVKLGPDGSGYITAEVILELWEHAGILSPKLLLADLGFKGALINIHELSTVLDKEIKGLTELRIDHTCNPHVALLQAFLTLYQTEIKCLRNVLEQMHEEREKLKCDVVDANNRATLLAQEVDDNVANMELKTQKHVRLLEQRHADLVKEATEQFAADKEHLAALNQNLETKIKCLETEEARLHDELDTARNYSGTIERENSELGLKIAELEQTKLGLERQIAELEMEKLKRKDIEIEQREKLMVKLGELQLENTGLRDKHDEMVSRIEALASENLALKSKCGASGATEDVVDNISVCEGVNLGGKRRNGNSPSDDLIALTSLGDESPRLGKVRKFHKDRLNFASNESGYDAEMDGGGSLAYGSYDDVARLQDRVRLLERTLERHSIRVPKDEDSAVTDDRDSETKSLSVCCNRLKSVLDDVKQRLDAVLSSSNSLEELKLLSEYLSELADSDCQQPDLAAKLRELEDENKDLTSKCDDLESGMLQLRNEYEKCEDYWQNKLEEERRLFEHEQSHSSEKLNELLTKLSEFEEQYLKDSRLPTIVESGNLEKQFTDLEQEFEDYKELMRQRLEDKELEISSLREQVVEHSTYHDTKEAGVQARNDDDEKRLNLSNHVIESTNLYSADTMPFSWNDETSPSSSGPHRQKRTRQHDKVLTQHRKRNNQEANNEIGVEATPDEPKCWIPMSLWHGLQAKKHSLELRCKKLQLVLKQQHLYDEQLLNCVRQQHWNERAELQYYVKYYHEKLDQQARLNAEQQERLARNDSLVKDLFVDNSYLVAKNQRLEQQCHMLTHNLNANSV